MIHFILPQLGFNLNVEHAKLTFFSPIYGETYNGEKCRGVHYTGKHLNRSLSAAASAADIKYYMLTFASEKLRSYRVQACSGGNYKLMAVHRLVFELLCFKGWGFETMTILHLTSNLGEAL